ncbi:MAG TPA: hypothetical protein VMI33_13415 [Streptosporangiaceae bacterium]|nr:hypothetical protein [Streptosporangiaceae bacterium]
MTTTARQVGVIDDYQDAAGEFGPLPADHPLRTAPRTLLTPHIGYVTAGTYRVFYTGAVEAISAFLDGQPIRLLVASP